MAFILFLLVVGGLYVWFKLTHYNDSSWVKERIKGRNADQVAVIRYFHNTPACLSKKPISDSEYDALVQKSLTAVDFKQKALDKIGMDESQLNVIDPVHFEGYVFDKDSVSKLGEDGLWRSSKYEVSWLFFSENQVYLYKNSFHMDEDGKKEATEEYFFKDVTNFSTSSDTVETPVWDPKKDKNILVNVNTNRFAVTVPGDKFYCAMVENDYSEKAIKGMKQLLREKKNG